MPKQEYSKRYPGGIGPLIMDILTSDWMSHRELVSRCKKKSGNWKSVNESNIAKAANILARDGAIEQRGNRYHTRIYRLLDPNSDSYDRNPPARELDKPAKDSPDGPVFPTEEVYLVWMLVTLVQAALEDGERIFDAFMSNVKELHAKKRNDPRSSLGPYVEMSDEERVEYLEEYVEALRERFDPYMEEKSWSLDKQKKK